MPTFRAKILKVGPGYWVDVPASVVEQLGRARHIPVTLRYAGEAHPSTVTPGKEDRGRVALHADVFRAGGFAVGDTLDVTLTLDRQGEEAVLTFADTGSGIDPRSLPLVFEPFFTTKGLLAGGNKANPGLGLSVAHGIIVDMGGRITVESRAGQGTRFTIAFPMPAEEGRRS